MDTIKNFFVEAFNSISFIGITDIIDILIIALVIYKIIEIIRKTSSTRIAKGLAFLLLALWLSGAVGLTVISWLLSRAVEAGLLALVILFQPELRRFFEKMGSGQVPSLLGRDSHIQNVDSTIMQTVLACTEMSKNRTGALIVFERTSRLNDQVSTGTIINADTTAELLKNLFFNKAPLHDGAVIIRGTRIVAAGCMLPLSSNNNLSRDLGMRHRAGIGMSEHSDAVVAIVSEETGAISVAVDGMLKRHLAPDTFEKILRNELIFEEDIHKKTLGSMLRGWLNGTNKVKKNVGKNSDK